MMSVVVGLCYRFLRGDQYAIALALLDEGRVVLGVLACPNLPLTSISGDNQHSSHDKVGCLFFAKVGAGTYMQPLDGSSPLKVSTYIKFILFFFSNLKRLRRGLLMLSSRCMSVPLKILKTPHSLSLMKQHTPCTTCLAPLLRYCIFVFLFTKLYLFS